MLLERDAVICGNPDFVAERLQEYQQLYGFTDLLCWTRLGGLDHRKVLRSMELMRDKVIPVLRGSRPPPPPA
jgi:alkanesulfonate monooxygenase SsuD/methylene tetrahydromethanopterin reductase-like flavin-dependent oxidoreductase (luciferase family)